MNFVACTEGVRALPLVGRSLALSPPSVLDNGAGVCVCLCACLPACAGAVTPRSAVAGTTLRATRESPILAKRVDVLFCAGVNVVARTQSVRALPSVGRFLTQCRCHACLTSAPASASACVRACLRARAQLRDGRRWGRQHGEGKVSPPSRRSVLSFCFALE